MSAKSWIIVSFLAVVPTAIGYSVWFIVVRECPVSIAALTIFAQALFGIVFAAVWVGEKLHWEHLVGGLTIMAGMVIGLSRQIKKPGESG
jgi:drug/metabolite transporter (DMT)-like permease